MILIRGIINETQSGSLAKGAINLKNQRRRREKNFGIWLFILRKVRRQNFFFSSNRGIHSGKVFLMNGLLVPVASQNLGRTRIADCDQPIAHSPHTFLFFLPIKHITISRFQTPRIRLMVCSLRSRIGLAYTVEQRRNSGTKLSMQYSGERLIQPDKFSIKPHFPSKCNPYFSHPASRLMRTGLP